MKRSMEQRKILKGGMKQEKNPGETRKIKKEQGAQKNGKGARKIAKKEQGVENFKEQGGRAHIVKGPRSTDPP